MKSRMQERCKDNPQQCEEMKAKMKERREQCKADPVSSPAAGAQGLDLLRQLVLDPVYQLK